MIRLSTVLLLIMSFSMLKGQETPALNDTPQRPMVILHLGMSPEEVFELMGEPQSEISTPSRTIYAFSSSERVEFRNEKLTRGWGVTVSAFPPTEAQKAAIEASAKALKLEREIDEEQRLERLKTEREARTREQSLIQQQLADQEREAQILAEKEAEAKRAADTQPQPPNDTNEASYRSFEDELESYDNYDAYGDEDWDYTEDYEIGLGFLSIAFLFDVVFMGIVLKIAFARVGFPLLMGNWIGLTLGAAFLSTMLYVVWYAWLDLPDMPIAENALFAIILTGLIQLMTDVQSLGTAFSLAISTMVVSFFANLLLFQAIIVMFSGAL